MSKFWYNNVYFGSNDSRDIFYDNISVYDKLKEFETNGVGGSSISSSFEQITDTIILERNGNGRILQLNGSVVLDTLSLSESDRPIRNITASVHGIKTDGSNFIDILNINSDGTITSKFRDDEGESVEYYGNAMWVITTTENANSI